MTTTFQYVKIKESESLDELTIKQLSKLNKKYPWLINAQVFFKQEKTSDPANQTCEIELSGPGPRIFASTTDIHFETAMKETISDLERQLRKRKEIFKTH
jgi:putative sigma-54 modulation protein